MNLFFTLLQIIYKLKYFLNSKSNTNYFKIKEVPKKITQNEIISLVNDFRSGIQINNLVKSYGYTKATINKYLKKNINVNEYKIDGKKIEILSSTGESINLEKQENTKYILEVEVNKVNQEFEIELRT